MVPVPEELAESVRQYLRWKIDPPVHRDLDGNVFASIWNDLAEIDHALLEVVARAALDEQELTVPEVAAMIGETERATLGTMLELNHVMPVLGGPSIPVVLKAVPDAPAGDFTWDHRFIVMSKQLATEVLRLVNAGSG